MAPGSVETSERFRGVDVIWLEQVTLEKEKILDKAKARQAPSFTRVDGGVLFCGIPLHGSRAAHSLRGRNKPGSQSARAYITARDVPWSGLLSWLRRSGSRSPWSVTPSGPRRSERRGCGARPGVASRSTA